MQAFKVTNTITGVEWTVIGPNEVGARKTISVNFGQAMDALTAVETELDLSTVSDEKPSNTDILLAAARKARNYLEYGDLASIEFARRTLAKALEEVA